MDALIQALVQADVSPQRILPRASLARYTTFRVGGEADVLVSAGSPSEIASALRAARHVGVPVTVIGNGSNLLVRDGGVRGLVLRVGPDMAEIRREGDDLLVQAGATLSAAARFAQQEGLDGLSSLAGIPGTLGGAVIMNAGAYGGEMSQVTVQADAIALSDGKPLRFAGDALGFSYRRSAMMDAGVIVTGVRLHLTPEDPAAIAAHTEELLRARREKQPLEYPSAGSTFKRPPGQFAAKLIDEAGLRGLRIGDAQVSEKHAGFVINRGPASAAEILALMDEVVRRVKDASGVTLEPEVRIIGEDAPPPANQG